MVQQGSVCRFESGLVCALLLCTGPETRVEFGGRTWEGESWSCALRDGGQYNLARKGVDYEAGRQLLHSVTVRFELLRNFDNLIGRAAHISFINNVELIRTIVLAGEHYLF